MSIILTGVSSAILAFWASKERAKTKKVLDHVQQLRSIPLVPISGLNTLLSHQDANKLVFLRGVVLPQSSTSIGSGSDSDANNGIIKSAKTGNEALVVEETITHLYNEESSGFMRRKARKGKKMISGTRKQVPFAIADHGTIPCKEFVIVNLEGLDHQQVPLQRVWSNQKMLFSRIDKGSQLQVDELTEEEILPMGSVLSAVGLFSSENGVPTIKPCQELNYFLTPKSKEELIAEISAELERVSDKSVLLYKLSVGLAGYAFITMSISILRNL